MWDIKYRPVVFSDVLGQEGSSQVLRARLREGKAFDTSYIFAGGFGCGKTTLSRILARAMLCLDLTESGDPCNKCEHCKACLNETMVALNELDAASQGTTADMRSLVEDNAYSIPGIEKRIYVLDEAHRMSKDAQDVLLKPIEDKKIVVIFCTTELSKIRSTISSRCEVYEIRKIDRNDILKRMQMVLAAENVGYEDDAVLTVIDVCNGHVRDVLNKLETVAQLGPVTVAAVRERLNLSVVSTYYEVLLALGDPSRAVQLVEGACDRVGAAEVSAGLAEAAMNSYRHANKIYADFSVFDRDSAERVHTMLGSSLPGLSQYFLRTTYPTKLGMICDVVSLCETGGKPVAQASEVSAGPPVVVQVAAPTLLSVTAPLSSTAHIQEKVLEMAPVTPPFKAADPLVKKIESTKALPAKVPSTNVDPSKEVLIRGDGVGPKGSSDYCALTELDHKGVSTEPPRGSQKVSAPPRVGKKRSGEENRPLTPAEFRLQLNNYRRRV